MKYWITLFFLILAAALPMEDNFVGGLANKFAALFEKEYEIEEEEI